MSNFVTLATAGNIDCEMLMEKVNRQLENKPGKIIKKIPKQPEGDHDYAAAEGVNK